MRKLVLNYLPNIAKTAALSALPALYGGLEIQPSSCNIMITNRCNLRCVMCRQWREKPGEELSAADWKKIIDDLRKNGFRNIHFTGGEPLLREDLKELVSYCYKNDYTVGVTTNGMLLSEKSLAGLIDAGIRSVALSIDALDGEYDRIRGSRNSFDKVRDAAFAVAEARKKRGIDAYINFTLMKDNIEQFRKVKEFADGIGLPIAICLLDKTSSIFNLEENENRFWIDESGDQKRLAALLDYARSEMARSSSSLILNFPGIDFISAYFKDPRQAHIPCVISQDRIYIDPYGELLGGCLSMGSFGNLKETSFKALRRNDKFGAMKRKMFYKECPGCSCGYLFNIRHIPGLILKDIIGRIKTHLWGRACQAK